MSDNLYLCLVFFHYRVHMPSKHKLDVYYQREDWEEYEFYCSKNEHRNAPAYQLQRDHHSHSPLEW